MPRGPEDHLNQHRCKGQPLFRERVGDAATIRRVRLALNDPFALEPLQPFGQHVSRDALLGRGELRERDQAREHQVAYDEERPLVAEDVQRRTDGTARPPGPETWLRHSLQFTSDWRSLAISTIRGYGHEPALRPA